MKLVSALALSGSLFQIEAQLTSPPRIGAGFTFVRPAGRTHLEVKVLY